MGIVEPKRPGGGYAPPPYEDHELEYLQTHTSYWVVIWPSITAVAVLAVALIYVVHKCNYSRHGGRYNYSALEDDGSSAERLEMERKVTQRATRDLAGIAARGYCRQQPRYSMVEHLNDVGSRIDKTWFFIKDVSIKTDRLMTLIPHDEECPIQVQPGTREGLIELFQAIQHPYIYPVLDFDFITISSQTHSITVIPFNPKGTLKDLIYKSQWKDDWTGKYQQRAQGLPLKQVQRLGRQILEALLYLQDRGFPPCGHIHSGNIILQNGVARLSGLENTLLGLTSRMYPLIRRRLRDNRDAIDSVCFGHVLFEMCAGYEMSVAHPTMKHLEDISSYPEVVPVLEYIFGCGENYPSVEEIACCDFFRNLDLREMRAMPLPSHFQVPYSASVRNILREVRRHQKQRRRVKRGALPTTEGGSTPTSSEASTSGHGVLGAEDNIDNYNCTTGPASGSPTLRGILSDTSPSPEHPAHRYLEVRSPQRSGGAANIPSSPEIFHTPPRTPPVHQQHHIKRPTTPEHHYHHHINNSTSTTIPLSHNARPLATTRSKTSSHLNLTANVGHDVKAKCSKTLPNSVSFSQNYNSSFLSPIENKKSCLSPYHTPQHSPSHFLSANETPSNTPHLSVTFENQLISSINGPMGSMGSHRRNKT